MHEFVRGHTIQQLPRAAPRERTYHPEGALPVGKVLPANDEDRAGVGDCNVSNPAIVCRFAPWDGGTSALPVAAILGGPAVRLIVALVGVTANNPHLAGVNDVASAVATFPWRLLHH